MTARELKRFVRGLVPPLALSFYQRSIRRCGYFGDYPSWENARRDSTGYDTDLILERVRDALLKVKRGEAVYERDSVLFDRVHHSWPLLTGLLWAATRNGNRLNVLDFGGSLGSSYFQNRAFLAHLDGLTWSIVEQEQFVRCGREQFADQVLHFYSTVDECAAARHPDVVLLSSVLPYLEHPYRLLAEIIARGFDSIIIDRTPLLDGARDRLTIQRVPAEIYEARYPAWMLGREKLLAMFAPGYELVAEFDALAGAVDLGDCAARDTGFIFKRKGGV